MSPTLPESTDPAAAPTRTEEFYGFTTRPFTLSPDLRFVYQSRSHSHAFKQVADALQRREGLIVITGEIGTGKTVLCRALLETFHEARTFLSVILDPLLGVDDLIYQVLGDFGVITRFFGNAKNVQCNRRGNDFTMTRDRERNHA